MPQFDPRLKESIQSSEPTPKRGRGPWPWMLLVAIGVGVGIFLVPDDQPGQPPQTSVSPKPAPPAKPEQTPPARTASPNATQPDQSLSSAATPGSQARALIAQLRGTDTGEQAHARAQQMARAGQHVDAYLLDFYAGRNGYGPAALSLAELADPLRNQTHPVLDGPDAGQAIKWYRIAEKAGETSAKTRLQALRAHLTKLASAGDSNAERLLLQWQ